MILSRDVQSESATTPIELDWVAVSDVLFPVDEEVLEGFRLASTPVVEAAVNLPYTQRGIHASRSYEAVKQAISALQYTNVYGITSQIVKTLLEKHVYSTRARAVLRLSLFEVERSPVTKAETLEHFDAVFKSYGHRVNGGHVLRNFVGVRGTGITACPCAKEVIREIYLNGDGRGDPIPTHMQRSYCEIVVESDGNVTLTQLLNILKNSFSSRTVELLKRVDEAEVVVSAIQRPRFVEDVARTAAYLAAKQFPTLPDNHHVSIRVKSLESIHRHNMESRLRTTLGEIRRQVENNRVA